MFGLDEMKEVSKNERHKPYCISSKNSSLVVQESLCLLSSVQQVPKYQGMQQVRVRELCLDGKGV